MPAENQTKTKPDVGIMLAALSTDIKKLESDNAGYAQALEVSYRLGDLAKLAAGDYYTTTQEKIRPKTDLVRIWQISFAKLQQKHPVLAAQTAHYIATKTGFGCDMGRAARTAMLDNASIWAAENHSEAANAVYEIAEKSPSSSFAGEDKKIFDRAVEIYAALHDPENEKHVNIDVARNINSLITELLANRQSDVDEERTALLDASRTILDFADKLATEHPQEVDGLVRELIEKIEDEPRSTLLKPKLAQTLLNHGCVDNLETFNSTLQTLQKLSSSSDEAASLITVDYLKKILGNDDALIKENPAAFAARVTELAMPCAENDAALTGKAEETFTACLDAIKEESDYRQLFSDVYEYPAVREKVTDKIYERALEKTQSGNKEQIAATISSFIYVAIHAKPHSEKQGNALEQAFAALDRLENADVKMAADKAIDLMFNLQNIAVKQAQAIEGLFKIKDLVNKKAYRASADATDIFMKNGYAAELSGPPQYKSLIKAATHKDLPAAINALYQQTMEGNDGLYPLSRKAYKRFLAIIDRQENPEKQLESWKELFFRAKQNHKVFQRKAEDNYLAIIHQVAEQSGKAAVLDILFDLVEEEYDNKDIRFSNLFNDSVDAMQKYIEQLGLEDIDAADDFLDRFYEGDLLNDEFRRFKWVLDLDKRFDTLDRTGKLAEQLGIDNESVFNAKFSRGKLWRLYNKHAFWDWANRQMKKTGIKAAFALASGAVTSVTLLATYAAATGDLMKAGIIMGSMAAGLAATFIVAAATKIMAGQKDLLARDLVHESLKSKGIEPVPEPEIERMSVKEFLELHGDGKTESTASERQESDHAQNVEQVQTANAPVQGQPHTSRYHP